MSAKLNPTRRDVTTTAGATAIAAALGLTGAEARQAPAKATDPVIGLVAEWHRLTDEINAAPPGPDGTIDDHPNWPALFAIEESLMETVPATINGALASLSLVHSNSTNGGLCDWHAPTLERAIEAIRAIVGDSEAA